MELSRASYSPSSCIPERRKNNPHFSVLARSGNPSDRSRLRCRLVGAERVRAERIAGVGEGTSARSATDVAVFAGSALPVELFGRVQAAKYFGIPVHVDQRIGADVAATQREESRGIDLSEIRNEDDAVTVANLESFVDGRRFHFRR